MRRFQSHFVCLLFLGMLLPNGSFSQDNDDLRFRKIVGARASVGKVLIHSRDLREIKDSYPIGLSADLAWQFLSRRSWEFCNCYPRAGVVLTGWDFDNRPILGYGLTAMAYVEPVFLTQHRVNLSIRLGGGLAYLTSPFDSTSNPFNLSYSTHINFPLTVGVGIQFRVNKQWIIRAGAAFDHISNGGIHLPNKGINWPVVDLGVDYALQPFDFKARARKVDHTPPDPRFRVQGAGFWSFKNAIPGNPKQYMIWGGHLKTIYYVGRRSGLSLGTEWVVDGSRRIRMETDDVEGTYQRGSILLGHQFLLGRMVFSQELGIYYLDQFKVNDPVYQRFGLTCFLTENLFVGFSLKTHRHVADFADLRLGWEFF